MKSNRPKTILILIVLIAVALQACTPDGGQMPAEDNSADVIATSVAATLAAGEMAEPLVETVPPPPSPTWTVHPTVTASAPETNFDYAGVSFYFNNLLADNIVAGTNPGQYDENSPWWSVPQHREFQFNNWVLSDAFHTPAIRIYPVEDFVAINENVAGGLAILEAALAADPLNEDQLRVGDLFNAGQLYKSNFKKIDFQNGVGARWLSLYGQAYSSIGWPNLFYTFQGLTEDGQYYVSIILPVNHPVLPHPNQVTLDDNFYDNFESYALETRTELEGEADNSFMPSLVLLDQLVTSLLVGMP